MSSISDWSSIIYTVSITGDVKYISSNITSPYILNITITN